MGLNNGSYIANFIYFIYIQANPNIHVFLLGKKLIHLRLFREKVRKGRLTDQTSGFTLWGINIAMEHDHL